MKKIIVLLPLLLFINTKGFGREIIVHHRFIPIDLERTYLVSECGKCGNPVTIDYLLYSPKTQYYYYSNGEMCQLESIKCDNCEEKQEGKNKKAVGLLIIASVVVILILVGALLG